MLYFHNHDTSVIFTVLNCLFPHLSRGDSIRRGRFNRNCSIETRPSSWTRTEERPPEESSHLAESTYQEERNWGCVCRTSGCSCCTTEGEGHSLPCHQLCGGLWILKKKLPPWAKKIGGKVKFQQQVSVKGQPHIRPVWHYFNGNGNALGTAHSPIVVPVTSQWEQKSYF